jgi:deoxyribose-phosphate aldolase
MNKYIEIIESFGPDLQEEFVRKNTAQLISKCEENNNPEVLKLLYSCIDLTSLNTDDNKENIWRFTESVNDFDGSKSDIPNIAAICVFPNFVATVKEALTANVKIAAVAGGFPASQTFLEVKIAETALAVNEGADEIDIVLNLGAFLEENWEELCNEIEEIKDACRGAALKIILETGLLKIASNIRKAAILSMFSGADFIKTSTGKVYPGANPEAVFVICQTIKEYYQIHRKKIGVKVSGGVRTAEEAIKYYTLVKEILGKEWLDPQYFRIGASSLTTNLLEKI